MMLNFTTFIPWLNHNLWASIICIIVVAYLVTYFSSLIISPIIHHTVGHLTTDISKDDLKKRQDTLIGLLRVLLKVVVWLIAFFMIINSLGINLAAFLAGAGVIGVAIGLGAQSLIKDFLSGLFIILENQYRVGDVVDLGNDTGTVEQITIRSTILRDIDGGVHFIPNGSIVSVVNKTLGFSKINLIIKVGSENNIDHLASIINETGAMLAEDEKWKEKITQAPRFQSISNFSDSALEIQITGKTLPSKQWDVTNELRRRLLVAFKKHKIELA